MRASNSTLILAGLLLFIGGSLMALLWDETPRGAVRGTVLTAERGQLLPHAALELVRVESQEKTLRVRTDGQGRFQATGVPVGHYRILVETNAHAQPEDQLTVREGQTTAIALELQPTPPFLHLFQAQQVFTTHEPVRLRCHGFIAQPVLTVRLYRVAPAVALARWDGWLPGGLTLHGQEMRYGDLTDIPELSLVRTLSPPVGGQDVEGVFRTELTLGTLPAGLYLVAVGADSLRELAALTVTDLGLVVKSSPTGVLAYASGLADGTPSAGARVSLRAGGQAVATAVTGRDGLARFAWPPQLREGSVQVVGQQGASLALTSLYHAPRPPGARGPAMW